MHIHEDDVTLVACIYRNKPFFTNLNRVNQTNYYRYSFYLNIRDAIKTLRPKSEGYTPKQSPKFLFQNNIKRVSHVE